MIKKIYARKAMSNLYFTNKYETNMKCEKDNKLFLNNTFGKELSSGILIAQLSRKE
jgi:hypothetical protein